MHYLLFYDVVEGYPERRLPVRAEHLAHARQAVARGELVLGGALANPIDGAVLVFRGSSPAVAEQFAAADPYVRNGLVTRWRVREWTTVVGPKAVIGGIPMKPAALVATLFLSLVAVLHLLRLFFQVHVTAGSLEIPTWASVLAVLGPGALAVWLWREQRR